MAIEFNDNIHVKINRPTDFRFGPFTDINQANATIPIAQRYHGLIFGVYTDPLNIATSDVTFYYYWDGLTDTDIQELGGKPPVDGSYASQASMIAAQATQTSKYLYYDGTSYWEYLGTTNGNITDYRVIDSLGSRWTLIGSDIYRNSRVLIANTSFFDTTAKLEVNGRVSQTGLSTSTYFGFEAGLNDPLVDKRSTGFGYQALKTQTGYANTAFGQKALTANTTGQFNDAFGADSLLRNTTGSANVAFGTATLQANTTGENNAAFGFGALYNLTTGIGNVGLGGSSLWASSTASYNVAIGVDALDLNTTGNYNVSIGYSTTATQTVTNNSIIIGALSRPNGNSQTNQIVIGYNTAGLGSNTINIGNSSTTFGRWWGNLLLGTSTNAGFLLDVNGTVRIQNDLTVSDTRNLILGTTTGTKIGTSTSQKIGLWNATPIVQPTTAIAESVFVENAGGAVVNVDSTFDGYTLQQAIKALRNMGALA